MQPWLGTQHYQSRPSKQQGHEGSVDAKTLNARTRSDRQLNRPNFSGVASSLVSIYSETGAKTLARAPSLVPRVKSGTSRRANLVLHQVARRGREKGKKPGGKAPQPFRLNQTKGWTWEDRDLDGTLHSHGQSAPKGPLIPSPCCKLDVFINGIAQRMNFSPAVNSRRG